MKKTKANEFIRIRRSKIHGNGAFAKKNIKKGTRIIQYIGKKITKAEAEKVSEKDGIFIFELNKKWDIDGNMPENTAKFINHSCDPNCTFEIKNNQIWIKARKNIKMGEELSYNYGFDLDGYKKYPCRCGAKNCVGYILDKDHWKKIKRQNKTQNKKTRVLVAMSGGVDSSVAAFLMKKAGYEVIGIFMKNWSDTKNDLGECTWKDDRRVATKVASGLGIPLITLDFEKQYRKQVIDEMFKLYQRGITPNPDVDCNNKIKFPLLWKAAKKLKADFIVTGHYARVKRIVNGKVVNDKKFSKMINNNVKKSGSAIKNFSGKGGVKYELLRAKDESKDQSYFLYRLNEADLRHSLFPIGEYTKKQVRKIAEKHGFENFARKSTVGICFVGKVNLKQFLQTRIPPKPGKILNPEGKIIGTHDGIYYYTIGQRIGPRFGIEIQKTMEKNHQIKRWYVASKNLKKNEIVAAPEGHKILLRKFLFLKSPHWINKEPNKNDQIKILSRIRQVGELLPSKLLHDKSKKSFKIILNKAITGVSEGQAIVLYQGKKALGGGVISF
ncbi:tRNA 2-thiouridine(34) synthase MnmA [Candidatus Pacearchaeota archaeon]|nr:tRNA 2-thiouridine(34) synthase MnmA [Candidatus Pacearchaeota archaeon]